MKKQQRLKGGHVKKDLLSSLFIVEFEYGANYEEYWCYEQMVLQLKDGVDCLKVLCPQFAFLFMFDNSFGHNQQREDGLNVRNMSKTCGKQTFMHDTLIKEKEGHLIPYP
jgi:hypothetical protein